MSEITDRQDRERLRQASITVPVPLYVAERVAWPIDDADRASAQREVAAIVQETLDQHRRIQKAWDDTVDRIAAALKG